MSFSRPTQVCLTAAIGIACLLVGSAIPTAIHIHDGGDQLHVHDTVVLGGSKLNHPAGSDHAEDPARHSYHTHGGPHHHHHHGNHTHTHFGHSHHHHHDHDHKHEHNSETNSDSEATSSKSPNGLSESSTPHVHLVIFGFEFTLNLPRQQTVPVERVIKRDDSSIITIVRHVMTSPNDEIRANRIVSSMTNEIGNRIVECPGPTTKISATFPTLLVPMRICLQNDFDATCRWSLPTDDSFFSLGRLVEPPPPRIVNGLI